MYWLHIVLAGVFGLVLPFICWGAEATPGHPHMRAHFVFLPPTYSVDHVLPLATNAHDLLRATADDLARGIHELCATVLKGEESAATPTTQSTPLMLAITLLLLAVVRWMTALLQHNSAGFFLRTTVFSPLSPVRDVATPPPRLRCAC